MNRIRVTFLDTWRALAVLLMVFFHLFYDLDLFKFVDIDFQKDWFWYGLPRLIVFMFTSAVGCSLVYAHKDGYRWKSFWKRFAQLVMSALSISIITYWLFPTRWIYFGTLHCIALCSLLALPFVHRPRLSLLFALCILLVYILGLEVPWIKLKHYSMDYIPPFPWFAYTLLGIWLAWQNKLEKMPLHHPWLSTIGRHALIIYIIHQPVLYGLVYLLWFTKKNIL